MIVRAVTSCRPVLRPPSTRWCLGALSSLFLLLGAPAPAAAAWTVAGAGPAAAQATTLEPVGGLTASGGCSAGNDPIITLDWSASTSSFNAGYEIRRADTAEGPFATIATIGLLESHVDTPPVAGQTYHYEVAATADSWLSVASATSGASPAVC